MEFLNTMQTKLILLLVLLLNTAQSSAENLEVGFIYVGETNSSAYLGVLQGLEEANLQGQFLGQTYTLIESTVDNLNEDLSDSVIAVISATDKQGLKRLSEKLANMAVLNVRLDDDALRLECTPNQLHIIPSRQMKADAQAQWLSKEPGSQAVGQAWHHTFVKFAARDLNKRYKKTHGVEMDDMAWAGWAAIKMISDTVARENMTDPAAMLNYLKSDLVFDGQKGINMTFRATGQLRQPILIVENDTILTEAPVRGVANPPTLESLGITDCPK